MTDQNGHCSDKWPTKLPALFCTLVVTMDRVMIKMLNYVDQRGLTLGSDSWLLGQQQRPQTCKTVFRNDMLFCVAPSTVALCHAPVALCHAPVVSTLSSASSLTSPLFIFFIFALLTHSSSFSPLICHYLYSSLSSSSSLATHFLLATCGLHKCTHMGKSGTCE